MKRSFRKQNLAVTKKSLQKDTHIIPAGDKQIKLSFKKPFILIHYITSLTEYR